MFYFGIGFRGGSRSSVTMKLFLLQIILLFLLLLSLLLFGFWWHYLDFCKYFLPKKRINSQLLTNGMILSK